MSYKKQNFTGKDKGKNSATDVVIQQPGEVIVPDVADGTVEKIAEEIYGLKVVKCVQLNGYNDKNYHIRVAPTSSNPHLTSTNPEGYVMKVVNTMDTNRPEIHHAQIEFMKHLRNRGIATQEPVPTVKGENVAFYQFPPPSGEGDLKTHLVCLRTFLPGQIVGDVTLTPELCFKLGHFTASMTKALQGFSHPFYETFDCLWSLNSIPKLKEWVHVITDVRDRRVVDDVIDQFTTSVLSRRNDIRTGFIHGDPNHLNILVQRRADVTPNHASSASDDPDDYVICGVLDFAEAACTHPLCDLAILVAYVMLVAKTFDPLEVGGHILAGYRSVLDLPELELSLLRVTVAGRLVQSLVIGAYSYSLYPDNEYLLTTAQRGWHVLHALWDTPADSLHQMWDNIQESYKSRSTV